MKQTNLLIVCASLTLLAGTSQAQPSPGDVQFTVGGGYELTFDTDIDDGSDFDMSTANFNLSMRSIVTEQLTITLALDYTIDDYDFDGTSGIGALDPWDDIHTQKIGLILSHQLANDWSIFGGPVALFSRESGANFNKSDVYGGFVGVSYTHSKSLTVGGGLGVIDSLEDDSNRFFPIVVLNWNLCPDLRLTSNSDSRRSGLELVYDLDETIEIAVGAAAQFSRFRLDDDGVVPDGIGETSSVPIWLRGTFNIDQNIDVTLTAGLRVGGEIKVEDENGVDLNEEDFDNAFFAGASVSIRF